MGMPRGTKPVQGPIQADTTTYLTAQEGPIMLVYGASNLVVAGWARGGTGNLRFKTQYRTFVARPQGPGAWTAISAAKTPSANSSGGEYCDVQSLSGMSGVMWIQGGIAAGLSAAGPGEAESLFQCFAESTGRVIASQTFQVEPDTNTAKTSVFPFGPPIPALGVTGAMVAGSVSGVDGTLKMNFVYREFTSDLKSPGSWKPGMITETAITGNEDYNSGNMAITPASGKAFIQIGVEIVASDARASLDLTLAVKY